MADGKLPYKRKQTENSRRSSFRLFLRFGFWRLNGLGGFYGEFIRLDRLLQIPKAALHIPVNEISRPFDVANKAALFFRRQLGAALAYLVKMEGGGIHAEFLSGYIGGQ